MAAPNETRAVTTGREWILWEKCQLSQRQIGQLFGGMKYGAVAQRLRRLKPKSRQRAKTLLEQM